MYLKTPKNAQSAMLEPDTYGERGLKALRNGRFVLNAPSKTTRNNFYINTLQWEGQLHSGTQAAW